MQEEAFVKSATRGLVLGHILLGLAGGAGFILFLVLAYTQSYTLIVIVPTVALAIVTVGALYLLQQDAKARREKGEDAS